VLHHTLKQLVKNVGHDRMEDISQQELFPERMGDGVTEWSGLLTTFHLFIYIALVL